MSRHRLVRNLDYEAELNDYDEFEEEEDELSPEDRALMTQGTVDVRTALGTESSKVTTEQIEEALWHYYYDVDKSVAYLVSKFISPPPPKASKPKPPTQKPNSKSLVPPVALATTVEKLSSWAENHLVGTGDEYGYTPATGPPFLAQTPSSENKESLAHWFADMPWGNIPQHRQTVFIPPPKPKGGLLGGSGAPPKMSKLQALAAARKKKLEEKESSEEQVENARTKMTDLSVSGDAPMGKENNPLAGAYSKRLKTSSSTAQGRNPIIQTEARSEPPPQSIKQPEVSESSKPTPVDHAQPSAFAQTLFGSFPNTHKPERQNLVTLSLAPSVFEAFSKPSPDDIVLAAQAKAETATKKAPAAKTKKSTSSAADEAAGELKQLKVDDSPLPRSQDLDVLSEYEKAKSKRNASFVVVGHVDAGKSTMMGRLLLDLNVIDQRTVEKLRKEAQSIGKSSFALAWVLDQRSEERSRGVTIDIATNRFETEKTAFTILDAPGHRDFIPNMIAGASQADFAILVIDASTGAFESGLKGQTREHSLLIRSMGVSRIIVAVNKLDTVDWSKDRFDEIKDQVSGFLSTTGFQVKNIAFVPVSGLNGDNLVKRSQDLAASWYKGATLIEELENSEPNARALAKPLRITISEVFRTQQSQVTISGRVDAGSFQIGDALIVQPSSEKAYVKSLTVDEAPANWAVAGQNVVVALSQIDPIHVRVGDIICHPANPIPKDKKFTMKALAFDFLMPMQVDVHRGRLHAAGRITAMPALLDKVTGSVTKKNPKLIKPGTVARITVELESVVPMEAGQRVVLRSGGETIAAGLLE